MDLTRSSFGLDWQTPDGQIKVVDLLVSRRSVALRLWLAGQTNAMAAKDQNRVLLVRWARY